MCSIAGGKRGVALMLEDMKHRAPDGSGIYTSEWGYEIGMGRLAIIDTEDKNFPFEDDQYVLTFNGEIYNYIELRKELEEKGYKFRTNTDTEVLLSSYREWGEDCLNHFNGMFAFAIYQKNSGRIFLARDIAGEKPLYYKFEKGDFYFASEAKALAFNCKELPPAHAALYSPRDKDLLMWNWWEFKPNESITDIVEATETLEDLLADSIRLRTRADVPYGLYLSGGVDSTLISTFHDFKYNFHYEDSDYQKEFLEILPKIVYHLDYPLDSFSSFGLWKLAEQAKAKGVKVVLSGEGADELFSGYIRYVPNALNLEAQDRFPSYKDMFPYRGDLGWIDFNDKMQGLLRMGDRMASAFGIENRCPFLDRRIIEFAFSLSPELKAKGFDTKIILRRLLEKRKPDYKTEEKHGLYCSVNKWLGVEDRMNKAEYLMKQQEIWSKFL